MKVFLSHQKRDSVLSAQIAQRLKAIHGIDCYLDLIDNYIGKSIESLADHLRVEMSKCTQLLAVISPSTSASQWVPWEVGVATEKDFPLATFSGGNALPPEFLRSWPYLRSDADLDEYARASKQADNTFVRTRQTLTEGVARIRSTSEFYSTIRAALNQPSELRWTT